MLTNMETTLTAVSFFEPCEVYIPRELLRHTLVLNLMAAETQLERMAGDDPDRSQLARVVHQRRQFLQWLKAEEGSVFIALYPTSEEELRETPRD